MSEFVVTLPDDLADKMRGFIERSGKDASRVFEDFLRTGIEAAENLHAARRQWDEDWAEGRPVGARP